MMITAVILLPDRIVVRVVPNRLDRAINQVSLIVFSLAKDRKLFPGFSDIDNCQCNTRLLSFLKLCLSCSLSSKAFRFNSLHSATKTQLSVNVFLRVFPLCSTGQFWKPLSNGMVDPSTLVVLSAGITFKDT